MFDIELVVIAIIIVINLLIFSLVISQGWRSHISNQAFLLANIFVILWCIGTAILLGSEDHRIAQAGAVIFYIAPMVLMMFLSIFATNFLSGKTKQVVTFGTVSLVSITLIASFLLALFPEFLTQRIEIHGQGLNSLYVHPLAFALYVLYFMIAFSITFYELFTSIAKHKGQQRKQVLYVFTGMFLSAIFSFVTNLVLPLNGNTSLIWLGPTWTLLYVITVSISVIRYGLFDIGLAVVRSVAYIFSLVTLSAVYYLLAYIVSLIFFGGGITNSLVASPINIFLALVLAFIFQPVKSFFDEMTGNIFFRNRYRPDDFYRGLSEALATTTELKDVLWRASAVIGDTMKAEYTEFLVRYGDSKQRFVGTKRSFHVPLDDLDELDTYVINQGGRIVNASLLPKGNQIQRILLSHAAALVLPLVRKNEIIGYLFLGDQKSGNYTTGDMQVLETISDELIIAIQNALSVQEVRDINASLEQRISAATGELRTSNARLKRLDAAKDEFISMASHQLRTPLTSVKGYLSMVLEGDVGKVTKMQRQVLEEAYSSSERMVHLIHDFLNVSRLQTGKFVLELQEVDISRLIAEEVKSLERTASSRRLKLHLDDTVGSLMMTVDDTKIRQVVMNYIDNAIFYSHPDTTISISFAKEGSEVIFTVKDTGIGVPKKEQAQLFEKFFRASNARKERPDGTGVGIFLAKKIIDAHGGEVIFSSKEGRGSTFGFRLPNPTGLDKDANQLDK